MKKIIEKTILNDKNFHNKKTSILKIYLKKKIILNVRLDNEIILIFVELKNRYQKISSLIFCCIG